MTAPAAYPRLPHLVAGRGTDDDLVLGSRDVDLLLSSEVEVEEKLDGANVMVWSDQGRLRSSGRAGPGSIDRAGQFGALRAWVAATAHQLEPLVEQGEVLYGEWLHVTHTISYRDLPSWFVALDVRRADGSFLAGPSRRSEIGRTGLLLPPVLGVGRFTIDELEALASRSAWSDDPGEGVVVRPLDTTTPTVRVAKLVRSGFVRTSDEDWRRGRQINPRVRVQR